MPTNTFFNHAVATEQHLYEDLTVEALRMYGHEVYYLPREIVEEDTILGEDIQSRFSDSYLVEMYLENTEGFEGEGDLFSKFGVSIQEEASFILSLRSWERFISLDANVAVAGRPNEGDLIYLPLSGSLFEIRFVEDQDPFFQLGKLFVFKLKCSLFEYGGEDFDTGTSADLVEADMAYSIEMTLAAAGGTGNYTLNENVTLGGVVVGEVITWLPITRQLTLKDLTKTLLVGDTLIGESSAASYVIEDIVDVLTMESSGQAENLEFETQGDNYLDFSETNPFGEVT